MSYLTLDEKMAARFSGISEMTELRTEEGKVLGTYVPAMSPELRAKYERVNALFDLAAAERTFQSKSQGRSLEEIWKDILSSEKGE